MGAAIVTVTIGKKKQRRKQEDKKGETQPQERIERRQEEKGANPKTRLFADETLGIRVVAEVGPRPLSKRQYVGPDQLNIFALEQLLDDPPFQMVFMLYEVVPHILRKSGKVKNQWLIVDAHDTALLNHFGLFVARTLGFGTGAAQFISEVAVADMPNDLEPSMVHTGCCKTLASCHSREGHFSFTDWCKGHG